MIPKNQTLYSDEIFNAIMEYEINRLRRYPGPITLVKASFISSDQSDTAVSGLESTILAFLRSHMRVTDVSVNKDNAYFIMLPMTNQEGARIAIGRLMKLFNLPIYVASDHIIEITPKVGAFTFDLGEHNVLQNTLYMMASEAHGLALKQTGAAFVTLPGKNKEL